MTPEQLTAIRARLAAITPGKWYYDDRLIKAHPVAHPNRYFLFAEGNFRKLAQSISNKSDAEFIANAPTDFEALLAYVAELEAKLSNKEILDNSIDNGKCQ